MGKAIKNIGKAIVVIFTLCFGLGVLVSKLEKNKGWMEGHVPYGFYEKHVKRPLDFGLSLFALLVLWPVMLVTAIAVRMKLGSPVVFEQKRPGLGGRIFTIHKFRTMTDERDTDGELLPDEVRLTKFGKFLRAASVDELPELTNIIKGDMSIIGPRPLLVEYLPRYDEEQKHRHDVRPGLTGLAQVSGRNELSWDEKFAGDLEYVNHITFVTDGKILLKTIGTVFQRNGIHSETSVTMETFMGNENCKTHSSAGCEKTQI